MTENNIITATSMVEIRQTNVQRNCAFKKKKIYDESHLIANQRTYAGNQSKKITAEVRKKKLKSILSKGLNND